MQSRFSQHDEGTSSPSNAEFPDEDQRSNESFDNQINYERADELTALSRQSMVPISDLIAYYQYIQQGDESRESSIKSDSDSRYNRKSQDLTDHEPPVCQSIQTKLLGASQTTTGSCEKIKSELNDNSSEAAEQLKFNKSKIRANVILELINSERDFVKHLSDVVEGYLYPARRHPEIFTGERINTIFANIEQLFDFQKEFLSDLELCIDWENPAQSKVGDCFLKYESGFSVYHYYCNNHPNAISELQDLYTKPRFVKFFEACRLLQNMIDISLDGFLLTPIQKICKYPLQLNELLKNTSEDHPDYVSVSRALETMRNCANLANERKRRIEALADVLSFQDRFENWFGPKLSQSSSILIHSGEVFKMNSHTWSQGVQLYLFDHLLVYAKKDLLKRNVLILKGRISMDSISEISDADEYKPKKSFKLYCNEQQKWFVFVTRSEKEKDEWIRAFEQERNLVEDDENEGFHITQKEISVAKRALQHRKHSRSARYRHKRPDTTIVDQLDLDDANMIMNRTLSLPSCIHPSHVMNFVEDSRVIASGKKNPSPSSSRSPVPTPQTIPSEQPGDLGHWLKKMGSKKFSRSQVYTINGQTGQTNNTVTTATAANIVGSTSAYDQLEKRHREHMVSEKQARLFRLNNDIPPPHSSSSMFSQQQRDTADVPSFETTMVLSSGRIVRVREDAV